MAKEIYASRAASDLSAAAGITESIKAPFAGVLSIDDCYMRAGEVVGNATTKATVYVLVNAITVASATPSNVTLDTIGDTQLLTPSLTDTNGSSINAIDFAAGEIITVGHDVAATGGTTTGTVYWHLAIDWAS